MPRADIPPVDYSPQPPAYNASGTTNVSGIATSGDHDGPWYIETQTLNIDYNRVPYGYLSATDVSLSAAEGTYVLYGTKVLASVNATYRAKQDWGTYQTSSWEQPQKFEVLAVSSDTNGTTYGDITASTMGPMGNIITTQEFYRRVPWVGSTSGQVEIDRNVVGANFYAMDLNRTPDWHMANPFATSSTETSAAVNQEDFRHDFANWFAPENRRGSFNNYGDTHLGCHFQSYAIAGTYATVKESLWKILQFIDDCGRHVTYSRLFAIPTEVWYGAQNNEGFAEYDITRHDYS